MLGNGSPKMNRQGDTKADVGLDVKRREAKVGVDKIGQRTKGHPKLGIFRADSVQRSDGEDIDRRLEGMDSDTCAKKLGSLNGQTRTGSPI